MRSKRRTRRRLEGQGHDVAAPWVRNLSGYTEGVGELLVKELAHVRVRIRAL